MRTYRFIFIIFFILLNFLVVNFSYAYTDNTGLDVNLRVVACNNDTVCDMNEDFLSCPADCPPPPPPPPTPTSGATSGNYLMGTKDFFRNLTVIPSYNNATIKWNSAFPTIYVIKWGTTEDYKNGTLKNIHFTYDHIAEVAGLETSKLYYFSIESESYTGVKAALPNQTFTTLTPTDKVAPANVTNAKISTTGAGVVLSWVNPDDKDFNYVRVIRNDSKYSSDPYSGKLVYEGSGQYVRDGSVEKDQKYFYTIFARDKSGNFSSGYPISIIHNPPVDGVVKIDKEVPPVAAETAPIDADYTISQNKVEQGFNLGGSYDLDGNSVFKIIIKDKTENKNEMWVEIRDMDGVVVGRYFFGGFDSYLSGREVTIPAIKGNGYYSVAIFRYLGSMEQLVHQGGISVKTETLKEIQNNFWIYLLGWIILLVVIMIIIFIILRRRKKRELGSPSPLQGEGAGGEVN